MLLVGKTVTRMDFEVSIGLGMIDKAGRVEGREVDRWYYG
jgi:hypothetical protein